MLRFLGVFFLIALLVGGWGYARGWFSVSETDAGDSTRVTFGLDKDKVKRDFQSSKEDFDDALKKFDSKLTQLKQRTQAAAADRKAALELKVSDFERDREAVSKRIDEFKTASHAHMSELKADIEAMLDRMRTAIDRVLES
jgi:DNA anti-recombination protein RmuC